MTLAEELKNIQAHADCGLPEGDTGGIITDLNNSCVHLARAGVLEAVAEGELARAKGREAVKHTNKTATVFRELVASGCAEEISRFKHAHNLKTTLTTRIESLRSLLSWEKEQAKLN